jgi:hypothetical protein
MHYGWVTKENSKRHLFRALVLSETAGAREPNASALELTLRRLRQRVRAQVHGAPRCSQVAAVLRSIPSCTRPDAVFAIKALHLGNPMGLLN